MTGARTVENVTRFLQSAVEAAEVIDLKHLGLLIAHLQSADNGHDVYLYLSCSGPRLFVFGGSQCADSDTQALDAAKVDLSRVRTLHGYCKKTMSLDHRRIVATDDDLNMFFL